MKSALSGEAVFRLRSLAGWQITDAGRAFLAGANAPISSSAQERVPEAVETEVRPPLRLPHHWSDQTLGAGFGGAGGGARKRPLDLRWSDPSQSGPWVGPRPQKAGDP